MAKEVFSSREMVVAMIQHYETLLVQTGMMDSNQPFIQEAMEDIAKTKENLGNRLFLTRLLTDELFNRDLIDESTIELEEETEDGD